MRLKIRSYRETLELNVDKPELSYFEMRDKAIEWLGLPTENKSRSAVAPKVMDTNR